MIIGLDFDGTVCKHEHPDIGEPIPGCLDVLRELLDAGHEIVLWTCRDGYEVELARHYMFKNDIELAAVNSNSANVPYDGLTSRKIYSHLFIDDRGLGVPLTQDHPDERAYVNWYAVRPMLQDLGYL